jgi:SAM-dependent methyltransferase
MKMPWFQPKSTVSQPLPSRPVYFMMNGRRMRTNSPYIFPFDGQEYNRLDFQHVMIRNILKSNYLAPIHNPLSILDVACGTGRWGAEMARQFPDANVVGIDINPPSIASAGVTLGQEWVADNYTFEQCDITMLPLPFDDNSFEFVHMRFVVAAIPSGIWLPLIKVLLNQEDGLSWWITPWRSRLPVQSSGMIGFSQLQVISILILQREIK